MLQSVDVGERSIEDYRGTATDELLDELHQVAKDLRGLRTERGIRRPDLCFLFKSLPGPVR